MSLRIDELAKKIATLDPLEQEILLEKVAELNFQRGLEALSQKYRERLAESLFLKKGLVALSRHGLKKILMPYLRPFLLKN